MIDISKNKLNSLRKSALYKVVIKKRWFATYNISVSVLKIEPCSSTCNIIMVLLSIYCEIMFVIAYVLCNSKDEPRSRHCCFFSI